jgi:hypothetical protein
MKSVPSAFTLPSELYFAPVSTAAFFDCLFLDSIFFPPFRWGGDSPMM